MMVAFPESEYRQRLARAREALREGGLKGYLAVAPEHLYYLAGYDGHTYWSDQGCVFTVDGDEPTLVIRDTDEGVARETAWVQDVRTYRYGRDDSLALIASVAREKGLIGKRLGADLRSFALPAAKGRACWSC